MVTVCNHLVANCSALSLAAGCFICNHLVAGCSALSLAAGHAAFSLVVQPVLQMTEDTEAHQRVAHRLESFLVQSRSPVVQSRSPVVQSRSPVAQSRSPVAKSRSPVAQPPSRPALAQLPREDLNQLPHPQVHLSCPSTQQHSELQLSQLVSQSIEQKNVDMLKKYSEKPKQRQQPQQKQQPLDVPKSVSSSFGGSSLANARRQAQEAIRNAQLKNAERGKQSLS